MKQILIIVLLSSGLPAFAQSCAPTWVFGGGSPVTVRYAGNNVLMGHDRNTNQSYPLLGGADQIAEDSRGSPHEADRQFAEWIACHRRAERGSNAASPESDIDTVTPQVPGCPKYLRKSMVQWRRVGNPQLNTWEVRNVSSKTVKITFRESGVNSSPDTLPPGQSVQVGLTSGQVPPYVVREFSEIVTFNNAQQRKSLECDLAIRPR